jgi:hypothetical protein
VPLGRFGKEARARKEKKVRTKERKKSSRGHEVENADGLHGLLKEGQNIFKFNNSNLSISSY